MFTHCRELGYLAGEALSSQDVGQPSTRTLDCGDPPPPPSDPASPAPSWLLSRVQGSSPMGLDVVPQPDTRQGVCGLAQVLATRMGLTARPSRAGCCSFSSSKSLSWVQALYWGCGTWRITRSTCWVASRCCRLCLPRATRRILAHERRVAQELTWRPLPTLQPTPSTRRLGTCWVFSLGLGLSSPSSPELGSGFWLGCRAVGGSCWPGPGPMLWVLCPTLGSGSSLRIRIDVLNEAPGGLHPGCSLASGFPTF